MLGLSGLPASPTSVAGYLSEFGFPPDDREPATVSPLTRRLSAIGQAHSLARLRKLTKVVQLLPERDVLAAQGGYTVRRVPSYVLCDIPRKQEF